MGSAKLPEQIDERVAESRWDAEHKIDPSIEKLRGQPGNPEIGPEEANVRRTLTAGQMKGTRKIAERLVLMKQLQGVYDTLDRLRTGDSTLFANQTALNDYIEHLKGQVRHLRSKIGPAKPGKRSKKRR